MKNHKGNARHRRKNRDQSTGCTTLKSNQRLTSQYRKDTIQMMRKSRGQNSREGNQQQNNPNRCSLSRTRMTAMSYCTILGRCNDSNKRHLHSRAQRIQGGSRMFQNYMCLYLSSCHHRDSEDSHRFLRTIFWPQLQDATSVHSPLLEWWFRGLLRLCSCYACSTHRICKYVNSDHTHWQSFQTAAKKWLIVHCRIGVAGNGAIPLAPKLNLCSLPAALGSPAVWARLYQ